MSWILSQTGPKSLTRAQLLATLVWLASGFAAHAHAQADPASAAAAGAPPPSAAAIAAPPETPSEAAVQTTGSSDQQNADRKFVHAQERIAPPGPVAPAAAPEPTFPEWLRYVKLGGGAILYYYQPLKEGWKNNLSFFHGRIDLDVNVGAFGFHLEPRIRDGKLRPFFEGPAWIEEGYASWQIAPFAALKIGKIYSRLGLFWDNSFYGNVQVYDGLKLAPDYGASLEGSVGDHIGLNYWAQFFIVDGRTNVSLADRDTLSVSGARRRNEVVLNIEPFVRFSEISALKVGGSLQYLQADLPGDKQNVLRLAAHAKFTLDGFGAWGEILHQSGRHVNNFPYGGAPATSDAAAIGGRASSDNTYFELGAEYTIASFTLRYNVSYARYADVGVTEWMHVPALAYNIVKPLTLNAELVFWRRNVRGPGDTDVDKSLNVTMLASF